MKTTLLVCLALTVAAAAPAGAQSSTGTSGKNGGAASSVPAVPANAQRDEAAGTITDYTPERSLVLRTDTDGGEPLVFRMAPDVTFLDADGKTIEAAGLRKNLRVRVSYVKSGPDAIIDKVTILD